MKYLIASFHNGNLPPGLLIAQKSIFDHFNIPLLQWQSSLPHGQAIDECLAMHKGWEVTCLFDADAFCRDPEWLWEIMALMATAHQKESRNQGDEPEILPVGMVGGAHNANHRPGSHDYASPACCVIGAGVYEEALSKGCEGFKITHTKGHRAPKDVGQHLSDTVRAMGYGVSILYPETVRIPRWSLHAGGYFGNGTDYRKFYHEFESRCGDEPSKKFIAQIKKEMKTPKPSFVMPQSQLRWLGDCK